MNWKEEYKNFLWIIGFFLFAYYMPVGNPRFNRAVYEALSLVQWYAREHVLLCLVPAFFIAGVIAVFVSQAAVIKYFGAAAKKWLAYLVASVSGTILAVCSCTVLPLFSGIYKRGAGLGPAIAFLYSGPAINILAIILTARILGPELGIARVIGAVLFSLLIGLSMHFIYRQEEAVKAAHQLMTPDPPETRPLWQSAFHFFVLVAILVFVNIGKPQDDAGIWFFLYHHKWGITAVFGLLLAFSLGYIVRVKWEHVALATISVIVATIMYPHNPLIPFLVAIITLSAILSINPGDPQEWMASSWDFAKQILPLLAAGVLVAGFLLGNPEGGQGIVPTNWITNWVGDNSISSNLVASVLGAFMYFATLTEVPILQGLISNGMAKGPALALLLAGPALSLPNMLVIRSIIGTQKTFVYISLVIIMATASGLIFGTFF